MNGRCHGLDYHRLCFYKSAACQNCSSADGHLDQTLFHHTSRHSTQSDSWSQELSKGRQEVSQSSVSRQSPQQIITQVHQVPMHHRQTRTN